MNEKLLKLISWPSTIIFNLAFAIILLSFHLLQLIALSISPALHQKVVNIMCFFIYRALIIVGTKFEISNNHNIPADRPLIVISNHQSLFDIPILSWVFRKHGLKYIAKQELSRGFPGISINLRSGNNALIDRKNPRQAIPEIEKLGRFIEEQRCAACIFPEGTRARDGFMRSFKPSGVMALIRSAPSAIIVPVAIENSWELLRYKMRPIPFGVKFKLTVLTPFVAAELPTTQEIVVHAENCIRSAINQPLLKESVFNVSNNQ